MGGRGTGMGWWSPLPAPPRGSCRPVCSAQLGAGAACSRARCYLQARTFSGVGMGTVGFGGRGWCVQ